MKHRDSLAQEIFIKRLQMQYLTDGEAKNVRSQAAVAYELADIFLAEKKKQNSGDIRVPAGHVVVEIPGVVNE